MLIRRVKIKHSLKLYYIVSTLAIPFCIIVLMRLMVHLNVISSSIQSQTSTEKIITTSMSFLLLAGPWIATIIALITYRSHKNRI